MRYWFEYVFVVLIFSLFLVNISGTAKPVFRLSRGSVTRSDRIAFAFYFAYPGRFKEIKAENDDLAMILDGKKFYWAQGRLLPEDKMITAEKYTRHPFYQYTEEMPEIPVYTDEELKVLKERIDRRKENPPYRSPEFFNSLWRVHDRRSAETTMKWVRFIGYNARIHPDLEPVLKTIEAELLKASEKDPFLKEYISSFKRISGFQWREIADAKALSYHSYGVAIDLIPRDLHGKEIYWLWTARYNDEWFYTPYERRYSPPNEFIRIFEKNGFIWGGKWFLFDAMHFEYRPEVLIANRIHTDRKSLMR